MLGGNGLAVPEAITYEQQETVSYGFKLMHGSLWFNTAVVGCYI